MMMARNLFQVSSQESSRLVGDIFLYDGLRCKLDMAAAIMRECLVLQSFREQELIRQADNEVESTRPVENEIESQLRTSCQLLEDKTVSLQRLLDMQKHKVIG